MTGPSLSKIINKKINQVTNEQVDYFIETIVQDVSKCISKRKNYKTDGQLRLDEAGIIRGTASHNVLYAFLIGKRMSGAISTYASLLNFANKKLNSSLSPYDIGLITADLFNMPIDFSIGVNEGTFNELSLSISHTIERVIRYYSESQFRIQNRNTFVRGVNTGKILQVIQNSTSFFESD